jgi:hypothetical protein
MKCWSHVDVKGLDFHEKKYMGLNSDDNIVDHVQEFSD